MCWILWGSKMAPEAPPQCATIGATMAQHASLTSRRQCKTMASVSPPFHLFSFSSSLKLSCRLAWLLFCCGSLKMDQTCVLSRGPTCEHCKLQDCKSAFFFLWYCVTFYASFFTISVSGEKHSSGACGVEVVGNGCGDVAGTFLGWRGLFNQHAIGGWLWDGVD